MADRILPPTENQALGPRRSRYSSFYHALALPAGAMVRAPTKLRVFGRWLSMDRRHSSGGADQIRQDPPGCVPGLSGPEQMAAAVDALRVAIVDGARWIPSLTQRRADSSGGGDDDDDESGHPNDQHLGYPLVQSLSAGDSCLFFVPGSARSVPGLPDAPEGDGVYRLSDVHENPWILKLGTETLPGPCDLTNETTRTWIMRLKITTKLVCLSKQQLHEQNWEQCFSEVPGQPLEQLLVVARSFSDAIWSDIHISQMLTVFDALVDVLSNIQGLCFSRSGEVVDIGNNMVIAFKVVIQRTSSDIRSIKESTIHPATFVLVLVLEFFCRNRDMVQSILESGDYNSDMVNCLISKLNECAEANFQEKGQGFIFVMNNIYYVLQNKGHPELLSPSVESNFVSLADEYIKRYLQESWFPLIPSYLCGDSLKKPHHSSLDKFLERFFSICKIQRTWKVQTELKKKLREEIVTLIVPKYVFLKALQERLNSHSPSWLKGMYRARSVKTVYEAEHMEEVIRNLFER
ncbi:hypothetical protein ACQ4PT_069262 [Festuca glaucescens]